MIEEKIDAGLAEVRESVKRTERKLQEAKEWLEAQDLPCLPLMPREEES